MSGWRGSAGQVRRRQLSPTGQLDFFFTVVPPQDNWKLFFKVVGLDDNLDIFFAGMNSPWRGLGRASMPGRRGRGLLEQGAQVGHGGVALALEFEVYDMVVHSGGAIDLRI